MPRAICIGCGCDDLHACDPHFGVGCFWMRFNADAKSGVCSSCEDLVAAWKQGEREPKLELIADRFWRQAMFLYEDEASARAWVNASQQLLGGRSPRELVLEGRISDVQVVLDQLRSGAYV